MSARHRRRSRSLVPPEYRPALGKWELWALVFVTGVPVLIAVLLQIKG